MNCVAVDGFILRLQGVLHIAGERRQQTTRLLFTAHTTCMYIHLIDTILDACIFFILWLPFSGPIVSRDRLTPFRK